MLITFLFFLIIWSIRRALPNSNKAISYRKISVDSFTASSLDQAFWRLWVAEIMQVTSSEWKSVGHTRFPPPRAF